MCGALKPGCHDREKGGPTDLPFSGGAGREGLWAKSIGEALVGGVVDSGVV